MGIFSGLSSNVTEIGVMAVSIVLVSILLNGLKLSSTVCPSTNGSHTIYNVTSDLCCSTANCSAGYNSSINSVGTNINTSVTGVGTPITYIQIIILVIVFSAILVMLVKKLKPKGGF